MGSLDFFWQLRLDQLCFVDYRDPKLSGYIIKVPNIMVRRDEIELCR